MSTRRDNDKKDLEKALKMTDGQPKYIKSFFNSLNTSGCSPRTIRNYLKYSIEFIDYLTSEELIEWKDVYSFGNIKPMQVTDYFADLKEANSTKALRYYALKNFFGFLTDNEYVSSNVIERVHINSKPEKKEITYLTEKEIKKVFKRILKDNGSETYHDLPFVAKRDYLLIAIGVNTGMRKRSITEIELKDIDFEKQEMTLIQKGDKRLKLALGGSMIEMIKDYLTSRIEVLNETGKQTDSLLITSKGDPISTRVVDRAVGAHADIFKDKHISPHKLRSTCATNLYKKTGDIYLTAQRLGHANVATTSRYAFVDDEQRRKAADVMESFI